LTVSRRRSLRLLAGGAGAAGLIPLLACQPRNRPGGRADRPRRIGLLQFLGVPAMEVTRQAVIQGLALNGFHPGQNLQLLRRQADGDLSRCRHLARELVAAQLDLLVAIGTPALLAAIAAAGNQLPIVFCYCSNPWGAGAGGSDSDHRPNVTGTVTTTAVEALLQVGEQLVPHLQRVGLAYNPAEPNSSFEAELLAQAVAQKHWQLVREAVTSTADLPRAVAQLQRQGVQALIKVEDYVTLEGFVQLAALALKARLPLLGDEPDDAGVPGSLAVVGWTSQQDGRRAGELASQVLRGTSPQTIPIQTPGEPGLWLNRGTARRLGIALPASLLAQAKAVLD
jgi:putative ABC transport system substrate-binding protein